jgi:hypothetical protein
MRSWADCKVTGGVWPDDLSPIVMVGSDEATVDPWPTMGPISFSNAFDGEETWKIRIIITPLVSADHLYAATAAANQYVHGAAVVCKITEITSQDFSFRARNMARERSTTVRFCWVAVMEPTYLPERTTRKNRQRIGALPPRRYGTQPTGQLDPSDSEQDRPWWRADEVFHYNAIPALNRLAEFPVLLTAADPYGTYLNDQVTVPHLAAVVGRISGTSSNIGATLGGFVVSGFNTDSDPGHCGFYYLALSFEAEDSAPSRINDGPTLFVDTGLITPDLDNDPLHLGPAFPQGTWETFNGPARFSSAGSDGDWQFARVSFNRRFATPPIILLTITEEFTARSGPPVVVIATQVTTDYFVVAARNGASEQDGPISCYWLAIGTDIGGGQGPLDI